MLKQLGCLGLVLVSCLVTSAQESKPKAKPKSAAKRAENPAMNPIDDQPGLPRVLLIGHSISTEGFTI